MRPSYGLPLQVEWSECALVFQADEAIAKRANISLLAGNAPTLLSEKRGRCAARSKRLSVNERAVDMVHF